MSMKFLLLPLLLALPLTLQSCGDDDDVTTAPAAVTAAFSAKYPSVAVSGWEVEGNTYKAEFTSAKGAEAEAWFAADGTWLRTETDYFDALPEPVNTYIDTTYPGYYVDDKDWVETPTKSYFDLELEAAGRPDVHLNITADGQPV